MAHSCWHDQLHGVAGAPLDRDIETDVLVIGAGVTGLTAAYLLARDGRDVTVLEAREIGSGDTGHTTAHLTAFLDYSYSDIIRRHGEKNARLVLESHLGAIDFIERFALENRAENDYFSRTDMFVFLRPGDEWKTLEEQKEALDRAGLDSQLLERAPEGSWIGGPVLYVPDQARLNAGIHLRMLTHEIRARGGRIHTGTRVRDLNGHGAVTDKGHHVRAGAVIVATHAPVVAPLFFLKEAAYRTYAVAAEIPRGRLRDALYYDTDSPYHYVRLQPLSGQKDLLIVGGEDHKTGQPEHGREEESFARLEEWTRGRYPFVRNFSYRWSGQVIEPVDDIAYIGHVPYRKDGIYMATGYSGNGITYGTIAGLILSDLVVGRQNPWTEIYNPSRKKLKSLFGFAEENANAAWKLMKDWISKDDADPEEIAAGQGAVVSKGGRKIACYRDGAGRLHSFSAVCTHLHCIVEWNGAEKSFDCPCHGSRFDTNGEVLTGPARHPLKKIEVEEEALRKAG